MNDDDMADMMVDEQHRQDYLDALEELRYELDPDDEYDEYDESDEDWDSDNLPCGCCACCGCDCYDDDDTEEDEGYDDGSDYA